MWNTPVGAAIIASLENLFVEEMDDGGMGSLQVILEGEDHRRYGGTLADMDSHDVDGMYLLISVIVDTDDNFYELDIFKGDFSPLIKIPDVSINV
ncbi:MULTISPECIES: DUF6984 family protein [unclassified Sphingobacterium]|uniref:DUF6984 family protein n=1 Tax=unclassified Sphingobacterium TaxID=2609468 RepID=UPI003916E06D